MNDETLPSEIVDGLARMGLYALHGTARLTGGRLTGGVSSDIWRIDLPGGPICVKRALGRLRVAADWRAPVVRNRYEARWMRRAESAAPGSAPALLGQDEASGALAMQYLPPDRYKLWKAELHAGRADTAFAAAVGATLARIHASTAADPTTAADFPTDDIFYDIRLEPYLVATALRHPDRAAALEAIVAETRTTKRALVHGDVSPKNILIGRSTSRSASTTCCSSACGPRRRARASWPASRPSPAPMPGGSPGSRRVPCWPARRGCCLGCCWPGSTANRRRNTSPTKATRTGSDGWPVPCSRHQPASRERFARPGGRN